METVPLHTGFGTVRRGKNLKYGKENVQYLPLGLYSIR